MFREPALTPTAFIDEQFLHDRSLNCRLLLQVASDKLICAVIRTDNYTYIALKELTFAAGEHPVFFLQDPDRQNDPFFNRPYSSVKVMYDTGKSTLVPGPLYEEEKKEQYLRFTHLLEEDMLILSNPVKSCNARSIFAMDAGLYTAINSLPAEEIKLYHSSGPLIDGILFQFKMLREPALFIQVYPGHIELIVAENGKLKFYNRFTYRNLEDLVYYPLFVCEQMGLNPGSVQTWLSGEINRTSDAYTALYTYFYRLQMMPKDELFKYSYKLEPVLHRYYSIFHLELCE